MLKKIVISIFFMFVLISPISANYPASAYQVPWSETQDYVIINVSGTLYSLVGNSVPFIVRRVTDGLIFIRGANTVYRYQNNKWENYNVAYSFRGFTYDGVIWHTATRNGSNFILSSVVYSSKNIINDTDGQVVFHQAPFQLPLTPQQVREGATLEALNQLITRISMDLSKVLPIGLLVLSTLLVIPLLKRWRGFLRL